MAAWIERRAASAAMQAVVDRAFRATALRDPIRRELEPLERRAPARSYLTAPPAPEGLLDALRRLESGMPQHWTSPWRSELLAEGLIETTRGEDGRWTGDRITSAGLDRLTARAL
jgi:hypothetical protein